MTSPFKFLDAYEQADKPVFFGRDAEIEQLYRLVFESNLVLVYGQSGTGKTSLIQCGLSNRFAETDWFQLFVRRTDDINQSLDREIRAKALTPIAPEATTIEAIQSLFLDHLRPIYLIFDQFEELFILGSKDEQDAFFKTVAAIVASDVSCRIIISLREEYLALLHRFEEAVPSLFNKRLRIEPMSMTNVEQVIVGTTGALGIKLEHGRDTAKRIIAQLDDRRVGVQLAYLQVYLDSLYQPAALAAGGGPVTFTDEAIDEAGKLGDIMAVFLKRQSATIEAKVAGVPKRGVQHLLEQFVTVDGTKQPSSRAELVERMPHAAPWIDAVLARLEAARLLRNVDGRFELAHDALAVRISETCSDERKAMLTVQKIVHDGYQRNVDFPSNRKWLSVEDLALVSRSRRLDRPGAPALELTAAESAFVSKSIWKNRWRRWKWMSASLLIGLVGLSMGIVLVVNELDRDDKAVAATNDTDWLAYRSYSILKDRNDETAIAVRRDMLNAEAELNTNHEFGLEIPGVNLDDFWNELAVADGEREDGNLGAAKRAYARLAQIWGDKHHEDETDLRARVRLKAILLRQYWVADDEEGVAILIRLHDLMTPLDAFNPVKFANDLSDVCYQLDGYDKTSPDCRSLAKAEQQ